MTPLPLYSLDEDVFLLIEPGLPLWRRLLGREPDQNAAARKSRLEGILLQSSSLRYPDWTGEHLVYESVRLGRATRIGRPTRISVTLSTAANPNVESLRYGLFQTPDLYGFDLFQARRVGGRLQTSEIETHSPVRLDVTFHEMLEAPPLEILPCTQGLRYDFM